MSNEQKKEDPEPEETFFESVRGAAKSAFDGVRGGVKTATNEVRDVLHTVVDTTTDAYKAVEDVVGRKRIIGAFGAAKAVGLASVPIARFTGPLAPKIILGATLVGFAAGFVKGPEVVDWWNDGKKSNDNDSGEALPPAPKPDDPAP